MENNENSTTTIKVEENEVTDVDSTTQKPEEVTKRSLRVQTWKKILNGNSPYPRYVFNRISYFTGSDEAVKLLEDTPEFKDATNIKVNSDRPQSGVKLAVLKHKKNLYVRAGRNSSAVFVHIKVPDDADEKIQQRAVYVNSSVKEYGTEIDINTDIKLDILVIGSCAVSRKGHRIGRGNGYVDLDFAILKDLGIITPSTLIVTTVHDCQVYDELPLDLFQNYDIPVDIIVTPTEIIRVANKLPRPEGIIWHLLSERRLGVVPVLKDLKEKFENNGKIITLKSEDTDVESNRRPVRPRRGRRLFQRRRRFRSNTKENGTADTDNENNQENNKENRPRRFNRRRRFQKDKQAEGDNKDNNTENKENNKSSTRNSSRRRRDNRVFCIKVSNLDRNSRIKDLKAELRKRGCNPMFISWRGGASRKCYLHFDKRGQDQEQLINSMLDSLANLTLTVQNGEQTRDVPLKVELIKRQAAAEVDGTTTPSSPQPANRIETTDVTAV